MGRVGAKAPTLVARPVVKTLRLWILEATGAHKVALVRTVEDFLDVVAVVVGWGAHLPLHISSRMMVP